MQGSQHCGILVSNPDNRTQGRYNHEEKQKRLLSNWVQDFKMLIRYPAENRNEKLIKTSLTRNPDLLWRERSILYVHLDDYKPLSSKQVSKTRSLKNCKGRTRV